MIHYVWLVKADLKKPLEYAFVLAVFDFLPNHRFGVAVPHEQLSAKIGASAMPKKLMCPNLIKRAGRQLYYK